MSTGKLDIAKILDADANGWMPIETAPTDGTHFNAWCIDTGDEYDEERLVRKGVKDAYICIAYQIEWLGGIVQFPWTGSIVQNRQFTHWQPLPNPPVQP